MGTNAGTAEPPPLWPDGNASLLRLLVAQARPRYVPGCPPEPGDDRQAGLRLHQLDQPGNTVRIRLNSLVYRSSPAAGSTARRWRKASHEAPRLAEVDYIVDGERRGRRVRAAHVVMACWNRVTAHVVEGLPRDQVENLCYARKVPLIYAAPR